MEDWLNKEHYCHKMHILPVKSSAYPLLLIDNPSFPPIWIAKPHFYKKIVTPPSIIFKDLNSSINESVGGHTMSILVPNVWSCI